MKVSIIRKDCEKKQMAYNLIVITGPTASGKTSLAVKLASVLDTEIISADSRQVYRGLDIGTGKDLWEYNIDGRTIPYHLIDIVKPQENFDLFCFYKSFFAIFKEFLKIGKIPILAGGTPLYIHSVIANYKLLEVPLNNKLREELSSYDMNELEDYLKSIQPTIHNITDLEDRERLLRAIEIADFKLKNRDAKSAGENIEIKPLIIGTLWERSILKKRITRRLMYRLNEGMVEEVKSLNKNGISWERLEYFGLEYKYVSLYLQDKISYDEMVETLNIRIHQFSKKQSGWFRKFEKEGFSINWVEEADFQKAYKIISEKIKI